MFLFELFWSVLGAGIPIGLFWLLRGMFTENSLIFRRGVIALIFTGVFTTASALIVTPREKIMDVCKSLGRIADEGDVAALESHLASGFEAHGLERDAWLDRVTDVLTRTRLDHVRISRIEVEWTPPNRAHATFNATCNIRSTDGFGSYIPTRWKLAFAASGDQWLLTTVESIPVPPLFLRNPLTDR